MKTEARRRNSRPSALGRFIGLNGKPPSKSFSSFVVVLVVEARFREEERWVLWRSKI
jgi:hypothetical protein